MQYRTLNSIFRKTCFICCILLASYQQTYAVVDKIFARSQVKDSLEIVNSLDLAKSYYDRDIPCFDSTLYYLDKALDISLDHADEYYTYTVYSAYVDLLMKTGNYPIAIEYYFKMLNMLDDKGSSSDDLYIKSEYESLYKRIGVCMTWIDIDKSLEYFFKSLDIVKEIHYIDPDFQDINDKSFSLYNNIGAAWIDAGEFEKANIYFQKVLDSLPIVENKSYYASFYNNFGIIKWELGEHEEAFNFYEQSLELNKELSNTVGIAGVYYNIGLCRYKNKDNKGAIPYLEQALSLSRQANNIHIEMTVAETLSEAFRDQGDFGEAYSMLNLQHTLKDSIVSAEKINNMSKMELQYLMEKQIKESELRQQVIISEKEQRSLVVMMIAMLFFFLLIVSFLLYLTQRIKNKKNLLEQESLALQNENLELRNLKLKETLDTKTDELNSHIKYLLKKKDFVSSVIEDVSKVKEEDPKNIALAMKDIKSDVESSVWNEFNVLFQDLHQDFYSKLYEKFPDLTQNEIRLCAFMRLNMSTKEISSITLQSIKSIEVARTRLRKKLGLPRTTNLAFYLSQF
ncbi:tetratricopeptide repeat protein [Bacteroidales bacterium OttesenSCG-928-I14]|nr:tetratricopeptide repeat protein [Bacteroidales bacterium OttesenSCG-928-I14]